MASIRAKVDKARTEPVQLDDDYWLFGDYIHKVESDAKEAMYSAEERELLVRDAFDAERRKFERLRTRFAGSTGITRPRIPESVRVEVWRRDDGKCARCGSRENLEYDHIVPLSRGGSNTARNIELLCEQCNRSKGANVV